METKFQKEASYYNHVSITHFYLNKKTKQNA